MFEQRSTAARDLPVPEPWATLRPARTVLAIVHNVTSATRLLDVLPILAGDPRIQIMFTCIGSSAFTPGTAEFLATRGVALLDWQRAVAMPCDLAIAASYGGPLERVTAPLLVLPHGIGYNKYLKPETGNRKPETGNRKPVFGLSPEWLLHEGRLVPTSIVLSHEEQRERLRKACPTALPAAIVAGDPCFDRILASEPLRDTYRAVFGVNDYQRLIFVSSTWGTRSLFGTLPDLVAQLRAELSLDEYAVAIALHPNTWSGHSPWQVRQWLHECERNGVLVFPPDEGWQAGLVACDLVLGDHGSVTYYGAALGRPTVLAVRPLDTVDPASAVGRFIATATVLTARITLRDQVERALRQPFEHTASLVSSVPGQSHALLRAECYRLLTLAEPPGPVGPMTLRPPRIRRRPVSATAVEARLDNVTSPVPHTRLSRYAAGGVPRGVPLPVGTHLIVSTDEPRRAMLEAAEIIAHDEPGLPHSWLAGVLRSLPGALLATMPANGYHAWLVGTRDGTVVSFTSNADDDVDGRVWASVVHAWLCAGNDIRELPAEVSVTVAGTIHRATAVRIS